MKQLLLLTCIFWFSLSAFSQTIDDLSFGTDSTFDVVTWNIEWFPNGIYVASLKSQHQVLASIKFILIK